VTTTTKKQGGSAAGGSGGGKASLLKAKMALDERVTWDAFLAKLGARERTYVERHLTEAEGAGHAETWQRLVTALQTLAPMPPKAGAQQALQFFVPDGKYRMQVFALHDARNGTIALYCEDVLPAAESTGLLTKPVDAGGGATRYSIGGTNETIVVEQLTGSTPNLPPFCKDMTGWNRKALKVTVPTKAVPAQVEAAEGLVALANFARTEAAAAKSAPAAPAAGAKSKA
jgi:hypothetical protein